MLDDHMLITITTSVHHSALLREPHKVWAKDEVRLGVHHDEMLSMFERGHAKFPCVSYGARGIEKEINVITLRDQISVVTNGEQSITDRRVHRFGVAHDSIVALEPLGTLNGALYLDICHRLASNAWSDIRLVKQTFADRPYANDTDSDWVF
jgi:hypothetical protein